MRLELDNWLSEEITTHLKKRIDFAIRFSKEPNSKDLNLFVSFINEFKNLRLNDKLAIQYRALVFTILSLSTHKEIRDLINPASGPNEASYWYSVVNDFFNDDNEMMDFTSAVIEFAMRYGAAKLYDWAQYERALALASLTYSSIDPDFVEHEIVTLLHAAKHKITTAQNEYYEVLIRHFPQTAQAES